MRCGRAGWGRPSPLDLPSRGNLGTGPGSACPSEPDLREGFVESKGRQVGSLGSHLQTREGCGGRVQAGGTWGGEAFRPGNSCDGLGLCLCHAKQHPRRPPLDANGTCRSSSTSPNGLQTWGTRGPPEPPPRAAREREQPRAADPRGRRHRRGLQRPREESFPEEQAGEQGSRGAEGRGSGWARQEGSHPTPPPAGAQDCTAPLGGAGVPRGLSQPQEGAVRVGRT